MVARHCHARQNESGGVQRGTNLDNNIPSAILVDLGQQKKGQDVSFPNVDSFVHGNITLFQVVANDGELDVGVTDCGCVNVKCNEADQICL